VAVHGQATSAWLLHCESKRCPVRHLHDRHVLLSKRHGEGLRAQLPGRGVRPVAASPPAIAYSRVNTGLTPSAVSSSSNFPASHLGSELGLIAQSFRAFFISATRPTRGLLEGELLLPICIGSARLRHHDDTGSTGTGLHILHGGPGLAQATTIFRRHLSTSQGAFRSPATSFAAQQSNCI
jgi:hypothetical protein